MIVIALPDKEGSNTAEDTTHLGHRDWKNGAGPGLETSSLRNSSASLRRSPVSC